MSCFFGSKTTIGYIGIISHSKDPVMKDFHGISMVSCCFLKKG